MIKTIIDDADDEEKKLDQLRQRLTGYHPRRANDDMEATFTNDRKDFNDSVTDAIDDRIAEIQQKRFNAAMDAWLTKTKETCRGRIIEYAIVIFFASVVGVLLWYYFSKR